MLSPQDRIYTTPDISVPAAQDMIRKFQLNSILRRYAYLTCANPCWLGPNCISRTVNTRRYLPSETLQQDNHRTLLRARARQKKTKLRSGITGAPVDDPYLQRPRNTVAGGKYGGVLFSTYANEARVNKPDLFKKFYPQKSPMRLPAIQREKGDPGPKIDSLTVTNDEICKHIQLLNKKAELPKLIQHEKKRKKRKRKLRQESEFQHWERTRELYQCQLQSLAQESDHRLLQRQEHFHAPSEAMRHEEDRQRRRISDEIKSGVLKKLDFLKERQTVAKQRIEDIPVLRIRFSMECDEQKVRSKENGEKHTRKK